MGAKKAGEGERTQEKVQSLKSHSGGSQGVDFSKGGLSFRPPGGSK